MTLLLSSPAMLTLDVAKMRELREAANLTQAQAASKAGMSTTRWNDIEAGGRSNVTIETLGIIAETLGCEPSVLLVRPSRPRKPK